MSIAVARLFPVYRNFQYYAFPQGPIIHTFSTWFEFNSWVIRQFFDWFVILRARKWSWGRCPQPTVPTFSLLLVHYFVLVLLQNTLSLYKVRTVPVKVPCHPSLSIAIQSVSSLMNLNFNLGTFFVVIHFIPVIVSSIALALKRRIQLQCYCCKAWLIAQYEVFIP